MSLNTSEVTNSLSCNCGDTHSRDNTPSRILPGRNAYRTSCRHILCEICACRAFTSGSQCPVCNTNLCDGQVQELMIGVPPSDISSALFATAFQNPEWDAILHHTFRSMSAAFDLQLFVQNQLLHELVMHKNRCSVQEKTIETTTEDLNQTSLLLKKSCSEKDSRLKELEYHICMRETELCEIKEAYKEKLRKCNAWEKAYNSLKCQQESIPSNVVSSTTSFSSSSKSPHRHFIPPSLNTADMNESPQQLTNTNGLMKEILREGHNVSGLGQNYKGQESQGMSMVPSTNMPFPKFNPSLVVDNGESFGNLRGQAVASKSHYPSSRVRHHQNMITEFSALDNRGTHSEDDPHTVRKMCGTVSGGPNPSAKTTYSTNTGGFFESMTKRGGDKSNRFFQ